MCQCYVIRVYVYFKLQFMTTDKVQYKLIVINLPVSEGSNLLPVDPCVASKISVETKHSILFTDEANFS